MGLLHVFHLRHFLSSALQSSHLKIFKIQVRNLEEIFLPRTCFKFVISKNKKLERKIRRPKDRMKRTTSRKQTKNGARHEGLRLEGCKEKLKTPL